MTQEGSQLDLSGVLNAVRRRWWVILLTALAAGGGAYGLSQLQPDRFEADADLLFRQPEAPPKVDPTEPAQDVVDAPERIAATNLALASLDSVAARVKREIDSPLSVNKLRDRVELAPQGQADLVTITATGDTAGEAATIANAFANEVVRVRRENAQVKIQRVIDAIESRLASASPEAPSTAALRNRSEQLKVEKQLETGDVEIAEEAIPPRERSSPQPIRNAVIGGVLGLLVGFLLAVLLHRLAHKVESEDEVWDIVEAPVLARVPVEKKQGWERELFTESFQFLRANIQLRDPDREQRVLAVTSALPGNGKSTVTARLAEAIALSGATVVAVDCDLRRPSLHGQFGLAPPEGVSTAIVGGQDPLTLLADTATPGLRLLAAGPQMSMPASVIAGLDGMRMLVERLRTAADYVVIDTSPVTIGADASTIASVADATLVVVDVASTGRDLLEAAMDQLRQARAKVIGVVLNRASVLLADQAYRGYYGNSDAVPPRPDAADNGSPGGSKAPAGSS
jgi:polysaccharide biosynthesis transport protein